jgi:enoyl-CoA hydratase/carnithine racemase
MTDWHDIKVAGGSPVGRITLARPDALNALTPSMMGEIAEAVAALEADAAVRAVLLDAEGRAFSAGGDTSFLAAMTEQAPFEIKGTVYRYFAGAVKALRLCGKPTVAAVQGIASGAGCELTLACDFRIAAADAVFHESWIQLGLISPLGGMALLPQLIGLAKANEMLLLGERVGADDALRFGLVNRVVPAADLAATAGQWAERLAAGAPLGLKAMKEGIRRGLESSVAAEWEHNVYVQSMLINSDDFAEGVAALTAKRKPEFKGS